MFFTEDEQHILRKIDGTEDIAGFLNPESVLRLMRVAKKMEREIKTLQSEIETWSRWKKTLSESADAISEKIDEAMETNGRLNKILAGTGAIDG